MSRTYESTRRREQAAETRARIVTAGEELLRSSSIRDWGALTVRAVAERAGVSERTVYRQFGDQRGLRDAVMRRFEEEAGVDLDHVRLDDVGDLTARILAHVAAYPLEPRPLLDPTLVDANRRRRDALLAAVVAETEVWAPEERAAVAGVLDLLWSVAPYERLVLDWEVDSERAIRTVTWVIELVTRALREGDRPG